MKFDTKIFNKNNLFYIIMGLIWLLAIFLRAKMYLIQRPLWYDELCLACSVLTFDNISDFFKPLLYFQKAPPLFVLLTKWVTLIFGEREFSLRIIPFVSSLVSIFLFYLVSTKFFSNKLAIVIANFIFAINYYLIYYAQEFKPYSTDVLVLLIFLLLINKLNFEKMSYPMVLLCSLGSIFAMLFSFTSVFIIPSVIIINLFNPTKEKIIKTLFYTLPIGICGFFYYIKLLLPLRNKEVEIFTFWDNGFLYFNIESIWETTKNFLSFVYYYNGPVLLVIMFFTGLIITLKQRDSESKLISLTILFAVLAAFLHLYPIKVRMALYLVPVVILLTLKPLDFICKKRILYSITLITIYIISFSHYNENYFGRFNQPIPYRKNEDARTTLKTIIDKYADDDVFVYPPDSEPAFIYYKKYFKFNPQKSILLDTWKVSQEVYAEKINELDPNQDYWFYFSVFDYAFSEKALIETWAKENNMKVELYGNSRSYAIHAVSEK